MEVNEDVFVFIWKWSDGVQACVLLTGPLQRTAVEFQRAWCIERGVWAAAGRTLNNKWTITFPLASSLFSCQLRNWLDCREQTAVRIRKHSIQSSQLTTLSLCLYSESLLLNWQHGICEYCKTSSNLLSTLPRNFSFPSMYFPSLKSLKNTNRHITEKALFLS